MRTHVRRVLEHIREKRNATGKFPTEFGKEAQPEHAATTKKEPIESSLNRRNTWGENSLGKNLTGSNYIRPRRNLGDPCELSTLRKALKKEGNLERGKRGSAEEGEPKGLMIL